MMRQRQITIARILTYSGTLPLMISVLLTQFPVAAADSGVIAKTYSAMIISFLSGIHWAAYLFFAEKCPRNLLIVSNMVTLLAWSTLLLSYQPIVALLQALCFIYLLILDLKLRDAGILPSWFYNLRQNVTILVILCLSAIVVLL